MDDNKITGYKAFYLVDNQLLDKFDNVYEVGQEYNFDGPIIFNRSGFHLCSNPEDTLRYLDAFANEICICEVEASGDIDEFWDNYYGYFNMYSAQHLTIVKQLTKEELLDVIKDKSLSKKDRFIKGMPLSNSEFKYITENVRLNQNEERALNIAMKYNALKKEEVKKAAVRVRV